MSGRQQLVTLLDSQTTFHLHSPKLGLEKNNTHQTASTFTLSYLGDACYELWCRKLVTHHYSNPKQVHRKTVQLVRCQTQSKLIELFLPLLSEEEIQIYKKGRNSRPQNVPKSASVEEYRKSTGFECLVGFWMLRDESERFEQLMNDENVQPFIESFIYSSRSIKPL